LHITNGDATVARLQEAALEGEIVAWRDVLHEGPVPAGLSDGVLREQRARFIAEQGWGDYETVLAMFQTRDAALSRVEQDGQVVLWFEHDLYDQLQLVQILGTLAARPEPPRGLDLICIDRYPGAEPFHGLGQLRPDQLAGLLSQRRPVDETRFTLAARVWRAFRATEPTDIRDLLEADTSPLPFVRPTVLRLLAEYPAVATGLSQTERQILDAIANGAFSGVEIFQASQAMEPAPYLGDTKFWMYLKRLAAPPASLIRVSTVEGTNPLQVGAATFALTDLGRAVRDGRLDYVQFAGIDRWIGGVHLYGTSVAWRWDAGRQQLVATAG